MPTVIKTKRYQGKDTQKKPGQQTFKRASPSEQQSPAADTMAVDSAVYPMATTVETIAITPTATGPATTPLAATSPVSTPPTETWTPTETGTPTETRTSTATPPALTPATPTGKTATATSAATSATVTPTTSNEGMAADDEKNKFSGEWLEEENVRHFVCNEPGDSGKQVMAFEVEGAVIKRFLAGGGKYGSHTLSVTVDEKVLTSIRSVVRTSPDFVLGRKFHFPITENTASFKCKSDGGEFREIFDGRPGYSGRRLSPRDIGVGARILVEFSVYSWEVNSEESKGRDENKVKVAGCTFRLRKIDLLERGPSIVDFDSPKKRKLE